MELRPYPVIDFSHNELNAPASEMFGIEVEAEEYSPTNRAADARALSRHWNLKEDGSLRNSGVEFVSKFLDADNMSDAIVALYDRTRSKWEPSIRTGIHVHVNCLHLHTLDVLRISEYYAFAEPILFRYLGVDREENIYCVPWYRAPDEPFETLRPMLEGRWQSLGQSCKYSSLFLGPLRTFGTIEFRHAPTFGRKEQLVLWAQLVRRIGNAWQLPDPVELYASGGVQAVLSTLFGGDWSLFAMSFDEAASLVEEVGADEVALMLRPCTYKVDVDWGSPCSFHVEAKKSESKDALKLARRRVAAVGPRREEREEVVDRLFAEEDDDLDRSPHEDNEEEG